MTAVPPQDPELTLLVAATARPAAPRHRAVIAAAADGAIDWPRVVRLVERHRVAALVFDGLAAVRDAIPGDVLHTLRGAAMRDRANALRLVGVLATMIRTLGDAGIVAVSIKGPPLARLAFGDASVRHCRDLDVLIAPDDVERALGVLRDAGFDLVQPADVADGDSLRLWIRMTKDLSLRHGPSGALVELHWRLSGNPHLLPDAVSRSRQTVAIGNVRVDTLAADDLLLYLCVHGARHFWFRLKWLADVHALLAAGGPKAVVRFHRHAGRHGLDVPAAQMLLLLRRIYGLEIPDAVTAGARRRARWLSRLAERFLRALPEPTERRFATTAMSLASPLLHADLRYAACEVAGMVIDLPTLIDLGGSRRAYAIAILGRPILWVARKARIGAAG